MKSKDRRILKKLERRIAKRLDRNNNPEGDGPVMDVPNINYEMREKTRAINAGSIGAFHTLSKNCGLIDSINENRKYSVNHVGH